MATIKKATKAKNLSAGPSKKTKVAGPVDPNGQYTKVQERTLGNMKKGGKLKKQAAVAIAMKKAGKAPKKMMQYGGEAASMVPPMKKGGTVKAKAKTGAKVDKKWIQKAINPAHKGYCTPMTKATCTPKRKALAKTLRKMAKKK